MEPDCLFCKMAGGSFAVDKLHDDDLVFAIRDINPRAPQHFLVVPKEHIPTARDVMEAHGALLARMYGVAKQLTEAAGIGEKGYRLAVNVGDDGGQTIYHLHMHVLGGHHLGPEG